MEQYVFSLTSHMVLPGGILLRTPLRRIQRGEQGKREETGKRSVLHLERKTDVLKKFYTLASAVIHHPDYQRLKKIRHHNKSIYRHNVRVAWFSFLIAGRLHLHVAEVVRGALLHDFFFYDWRTYRNTDYLLPHGFTHPAVSYKNAVETFGELTPREKDIIVKHMWPLTIVPPRYVESLLVSLVDKALAGRETCKKILSRKEKD